MKILKIGDTVHIGDLGIMKKSRMIENKKMEYEVPPKAIIAEGIVTEYIWNKEAVKIEYPEYIGYAAWFHFSFEPLDIGCYGSLSFLTPDKLPYNHVGMVVDKNPQNLCTRNLDSKRCRIIYEPDFNVSGAFKLEPLDGSPIGYYTSKQWSRVELLDHLALLKGKSVKGKGKIHSIFYNGVSVPQIDLKQAKDTSDTFIMVEFQNNTLTGFPLALFS
jgi:hypothetical protein